MRAKASGHIRTSLIQAQNRLGNLLQVFRDFHAPVIFLSSTAVPASTGREQPHFRARSVTVDLLQFKGLAKISL